MSPSLHSYWSSEKGSTLVLVWVTYLDKANGVCPLSEALPAQIKTVFPNQTSLVGTDAAKPLELDFVQPGLLWSLPLARALAELAGVREPKIFVGHPEWPGI